MCVWGLLVTIESLMMALLLVAFYMVSERKILSYIQLRKGPKKVGIAGLLQSFADFMKLLGKSKIVEFGFRSWFSLFGCVVLACCALAVTEMYALVNSGFWSKWTVLFFLVVSSLLGYSALLIGWCSWSKYSLISSMRVSFSSVMFEMVFMCVVILFGLMYDGYGKPNVSSVLLLIAPLMFVAWLMVLFSENNRTPFDYAESESELVSGISVEYSSMFFLVMFAFEYLVMFMFSWVSCMLFLGVSEVMMVVFLVLFMMMRGSFPRLRFDVFVSMMWESCVVIILLYLMCLFSL